MPVIPWWALLVAFASGALLSMCGVALGGWFVYRTKREPYESLFSTRPQGEAFNLEDDLIPNIIPSEKPVGPSGLTIPTVTEELNKRVQSQLHEVKKGGM